MSSSHLKRLAMPRSWALPRKTTIWVTRPRPGAHSLEMCMPLTIILRDVLEYARNAREVRRMLHLRKVMVDGKVVTDPRRGVGLMDVLTVGEDNYRCVLDERGKLRYRRISKKDSSWKVCRIENKSTIKGGKIQLNLHDGRNIIVEKGNYSTGDSLKLDIPSQEIKKHLQFTEGSKAYLIGGSHIGEIANVSEYIVKRSSMPNEVLFTEGFGTISNNVFVVSKDTPLPEVNVQ